MRKWLVILLAATVSFAACVGQKEDPEEFDPSRQGNTQEPSGALEGTVFYHRVLALGFTATWCQYCPNMSEAIEDASAQRPGRIIPLSVHYMDELSPAEAVSISSAFGVSEYPSLIFDLDGGTLNGGQDPSRIVEYVDVALKAAPCGISAESAVEDGTLKLDVIVKAVKDATYTVAAAWAQDGVSVAQQAGYGPGYVCKAVLRGYLEPGTEGRALHPLKEGDEGMVSFQAAIPDFENLYIVVYVLEDGKAVNAIRLTPGEIIPFEYEKTE